ncbi:MAG: hypothetical protein KDD66_03515 [Bdellovibrionales bacterium]|nr:hypothetical protein [Bdellovibrionales bacterium]
MPSLQRSKSLLISLPALTVSVLALLTLAAYFAVPSIILIDICETLGGGWLAAKPALLLMLWASLAYFAWGRKREPRS